MNAEVTEIPYDTITESWYGQTLCDEVVFCDVLNLAKNEVNEHHAHCSDKESVV